MFYNGTTCNKWCRLLYYAMGRLLTLEDLDADPSWYFSDAHYSIDARRYVYKWPSPDFPHQVSIHSDDLSKYKDRKIKIRQWIERQLSDTVIFSIVDKNYRIYYGEKWDWDHSYERRNNWYVFYFEDEHSAMTFRLAFSELVKEMTDLHPDGGDEYEKTSYYKKDR